MKLFSIGMTKHQSGDIMINYRTISAFDKDFKALAKRFKTLPDDFDIFNLIKGYLVRKRTILNGHLSTK